MIISNLKLSHQNDLISLSVLAEYEDSCRAPQTLSISLAKKYEHMIAPGYEAFLLGCFSAALYHQEQRIHIAGSLCPYLKNNIHSALRLQKKWWLTADHFILEITAENYAPASFHNENRAAGCFYSGGIDSLASILTNSQCFDEKHPYRYKYAFLVYGLDIGDPNRDPRPDLFQSALDRQAPLAKQMGMELIPIWTNIRDIEPDRLFYERMHFGGMLSGLSHAMSQSISRCSIASDITLELQDPWGSHSALNACFSSSYLTFTTETSHLDRTEKTDLVAQNNTALSSIRVCFNTNYIEGKYVNCGKCEKCIRTKLALQAYDKLDACDIFPDREIDYQVVLYTSMPETSRMEYYNEALSSLLEQQGHLQSATIVRTIHGHPAFKYKMLRAKRDIKGLYWRLSRKLKSIIK